MNGWKDGIMYVRMYKIYSITIKQLTQKSINSQSGNKSINYYFKEVCDIILPAIILPT